STRKSTTHTWGGIHQIAAWLKLLGFEQYVNCTCAKTPASHAPLPHLQGTTRGVAGQYPACGADLRRRFRLAPLAAKLVDPYSLPTTGRRSLPLEFGWSLQPLRACVVETGLEKGSHVARVKWAVRSDREGRRNKSEVEIGALARGKKIEPEEVTGRVALVDSGQRALSNTKEVGLCRLPLGRQFGIRDDVEPVLRRCRVEWL